jgi:lycopene cyclase domain-containing protein
MNYLYLMINILVIIFPFIFSFERRIAFYRKWPAFAVSFFFIGVPYIIWDMLMTKYDVWGFNNEYILNIHVLSIPFEEALFFITIPYACLFTFEVIEYFAPSFKVPYSKWPYIVLGGMSMVAAIPFLDQTYTLTVLIALGLTLIATPFVYPVFSKGHFWIFTVITLFLFMIVNYFLTSIPIVWYWHGDIWGGDGAWNGRFITIPFEDFIYNFAMLTGYVAVYLRFRDRVFSHEG